MNDQLEHWLQQEKAQKDILRTGPGAGVITPEQALAMSGLQLMHAMMQGKVHYPPIGDTMDYLLIEAEHGRAVFQGTPSQAHFNPMGSVHGGWFATILDSALACAINASLNKGKSFTTLELKVNMIRALSPKVKRVRAIGQLIHLGSQTATSDARLMGPDGKLYAHASTTCLIFDIRSHS